MTTTRNARADSSAYKKTSFDYTLLENYYEVMKVLAISFLIV